jgi:hypothetical protein
MPSLFGPQSRHASLFGDIEEEPVVDRASMLPLGQYADGSLTLAWPGMIKDTYDSLVNSYGDVAAGRTPRTQDVLNVASAPVMGNLAAKAIGQEFAVPSARFAEQAAQPSTGAPIRAQAYRGSGSTSTPTREFWASSSPDVANSYTGLDMLAASEATGVPLAAAQRFEAPNVSPVNMEFSNPLTVSRSKPYYWSEIPFEGGTVNADALAGIAANRGHDGLILQNILDSVGRGQPATTFAALKPNTVRSATTGETLFANPAEGSLLSLAQQFLNQDERQR